MRGLIFSIFIFLIFFYYFRKKREYGLNVIIFSIPFSYTNLFSEVFGGQFPISITGILIVFYYVLSGSWRVKYFSNIFFKYFRIILMFYLIWGVSVAFIYYSDATSVRSFIGEIPTQLGMLEPMFQLLYHSMNLILCIIFLRILRVYFQKEENIYAAAYIFSMTIIPNFLFQILQVLNFNDLISGLFLPGEISVADTPRYFGLYRIFGFGIYIAMVVVFSLHYKFKYYKLTFISALLFGLLSGERQALIFPAVVLIVYTLFIKGNLIKKLFYIVGLALIGYFLLFILKDQIGGIGRLWLSIEMTQNNKVLEASGRDVQGIPYIIDALKDWPIMGKGLYNWGYFKGVKSYYADHVVLFNIYQKFGLFGFILFVGAISSLLITVIKKIITAKNKEPLAVVLGLMISFVGMQLLDNFFWFTNTMLLYVLMFSIILSLLNRNISVSDNK